MFKKHYIRLLLVALSLSCTQSELLAWRDRHGDRHGAGDVIAPTFLGTAIGGIAGGGKGALIGGGIGLGTGLITHEVRKSRDRRRAREERRSSCYSRRCKRCGDYHQIEEVDKDEYIRQLEQENEDLRRVKKRRYRNR